MARKKDTAKAEKSKLLKSAKRDLTLAQKIAKWDAKQAQIIAKKQIKEMRPYLKKLKGIDLRKSISPQQRGYLNKVWSEYTTLTARPTKIYRARNKKNLKTAQKFAQHETGTFDVAFIPTADRKAKITVNKGKVKLRGKYVTETTAFFNFSELMTNPDAEIARVLSEFPNAKKFIIKAGEYEYNGPLTAKQARKEVHNIMAKYSNEDANNYYQNWMAGVKVFSFDSQQDFIDYVRLYDKQRKEVLQKGKNKRRANQRRHGKRF